MSEPTESKTTPKTLPETAPKKQKALEPSPSRADEALTEKELETVSGGWSGGVGDAKSQ